MDEDKTKYNTLIGRIGGHKGYLTRLSNSLAQFEVEEVLAGPVLIAAEQQVKTISDRLVMMQGIFDELLGNPNHTDDDLDTYHDYVEGINTKLAILKFKVSSSKKSVLNKEPVSPVAQASLFDSAIKYPEMKLPKFSGGPNGARDFRPFYQVFKALVEDKDIPDIYKVQYLRGCLPDDSEAFRLISHIPPVAENFSLHLAMLMSRYQDDPGEANRLRRVLMQVSSWSVCNSVESQRKLVDHVRQNMALLSQVEPLEVEDMRCLALDLAAIIPERLRYKLVKMEKEDRTIDAILRMVEDNIKRHLEVRSLTDSSRKPGDAGRRNQQSSNSSRSYPQSHAFYSSKTSGSKEVKRDSRPCFYCSGTGHSPHDCTKKSRDERAALASARCWNCLSESHQVKDCRVPPRCKCGSRGKHSASLCGATPPWKLRRTREAAGVTHSAVDFGLFSPSLATATYLSTFVVDIPTKSGGVLKARLVLDGCSTHSYGLESVLDQLPVIEKGPVDITVSTFSGRRQISARMVGVPLPGGVTINVVATNFICDPMHGHRMNESSMKELEGYQLGDPSCVQERSLPIDILLGVTNYWKVVTDEVARLPSGLVLMSTRYGWVLSGEAPASGAQVHSGSYLAHALFIGDTWCDSRGDTLSESRDYGLAQDSWSNSYSHALCTSDSAFKESDLEFIGPHVYPSSEKEVDDPDLAEVKCDLEKFWDLDTLGIKPDREISPVLEDFQHALSHDAVTGRYTVSLPRKRNIIHLPSNFSNSLGRFNSLKTKLKKPGNEEFARKYCAVVEDQIQQGILEKVHLPDEERQRLEKYASLSCGSFYLPHHGVQKERSEKVRVVLDGSARAYKGALSLNQCLLVGPSLVNLLAEVLLSFRLHPVALVSDIEKAFLRIGVTEADRDLLRFLWFDKDDNLEVYRFTRVPFGTGPSPFLLNATLKHHFEKVVEDHDLLLLLLRSLYVDDCLTGAESDEAVLSLKESLEKIIGQAGMKFHSWDSSSQKVREVMGVEDEPDDKVILGVKWNRRTDDMGINLSRVLGHLKGASTKRELLRGTSKLYDPHGIFAPVGLVPKLMFQKICGRKFAWDDPLPEEVDKQWREWRDQLELLERARVQRHVLLPKYDGLELHGFSDASQSAYSAVVYIKSTCGTASASNLIMCKNRVAPQKKLTIPRLELMGALLLARLMAVIVAFLKHLKISSIVYYSDSQNVLYWIRTEHRMWGVFVSCRIKEINALSNFADWKWVPTLQNPADLATRGLKSSELLGNKLWFHGPEFLISGRAEPEFDASHPTAECLKERKKEVHIVVPVQSGVSTVIKCEDFSSFHKLLARTVLYLRFVYWAAKKFSRDPGDRFDFTVSELYAQARLLWVKSVQSDSYYEEIRFCTNNPVKIPSGMKVPTSLLKQLHLFLDAQGVLRTKTRLQEAVVDESVKNPILLSKDHYVTRLLIVATHERLLHAGVRQVMSSMRGVYWIPHCRRTVSKIIRACVKCRRVSAGFYPVPDPPPLPDFRVAKVDCFDHIGVDHCGPLYVKEGSKVQKAYVLILTCAVSRAVHLELVGDMSVQHFMLGFRRFVARRGLPAFILSDNSKTFKCAGTELTTILNSPKFQRYLNGRNIRWQRYLEYSPWWGGWVERLNHVFKSALRKVIGGARVSFDELSTLLIEIESVINSRPITYVYDDVNEGQAITPSVLLCGKDLTQLPPNMFEYRFERKHPQTCRERLKYLDKIKTYFWTRWTREYLAELTVKHAGSRKGEVREPKVDDIVLVKEGGETVKIPRHLWKLGRVVAVFEGRDKKVRSVDVQLAQVGEGKADLLRHKSPRHLVPLECEVTE